MTNTVEIQSPDGEISKVSVNKHVFEILGRMHLPPYAWSELLTANQIDAAEMEKLIKTHYSSDSDSDESDL